MLVFDHYVMAVRRAGVAASNRWVGSRLFRMSLRLRREWLETVARRRPDTVRSLYGVRLAGNWDDSTFRMYLFGSYGFFLANFLARRTAPFVFLDIGANQGLYSILAARNRNCVQVHAFEPVPPVADLLTENLALNRTRKVIVHRRAISDRTGQIEIAFDPRHSGTSSLSAVRDGAVPDRARTIRLETIDHRGLNALIGTDETSIVIKIDVEGHEETVVSELVKCRFFPLVDAVFYECDETASDVAAIESLLRRHGFADFVKVGMGTHYDTLARRPAAQEAVITAARAR
jgi:FkbM family methyltransferase